MARIHPVIDGTEADKQTETERNVAEAAARNDPAARHDPQTHQNQGNPKRMGDPIARTKVDEPLEEELRTPTVRGPVFWWTVGLMLLAAFVALLWLGNDLQVFG